MSIEAVGDPREIPSHLREVIGDARVYTLTDLYQGTQGIMQRVRNWGTPWVVGEITDVKERAGGHLVFGLRDAGGRLDCFLHAKTRAALKFDIEQGLAALVKVSFDVYAQTGKIQGRVLELLPRDKGPRQLAYEQTLTKLTAEGLLDPARKRPMPRFPRRIGIVTSSRGKVVEDLIGNLLRRWPRMSIKMWSVTVQGENAVDDLVRAIKGFNKHLPSTDVLIVGRGGGSLDDLWTFNDEALARAIAASNIPVMVSLGHSTDRSIAGLVADGDAPTPSTAAEMVTQTEEAAVVRRLDELAGRQVAALDRLKREVARRVEAVERRRVFCEMSFLTERVADRLSQLGERIPLAARGLTVETRHRLDEADRSLGDSMNDQIRGAKESFEKARLRLHGASPLGLLERGYSVAERVDGKVVKGPNDVKDGDQVRLRTHGGDIDVEVRS